MEQVFTTADKLSEVLKNMQTCLQCTICLNTISDPVKTLCGHRFCRPCIQTVLQNKNALCPLCNTTIQRRSITTDEDMRVYIERLDRLVEAIQADSGIDITTHLGKPRTTKENFSPKNANSSAKYEEYVKPSCSVSDLGFKKLPNPRAYGNAKKRRRTTKEARSKRKDSTCNEITSYLSKYRMSGVEPLADDTSNDCQEEETEHECNVNSRVHKWLEALPGSEHLEIPDKIASEQPVECNLDDTLPISVSQNLKGNKLDDYSEADEQQRRQSPLRSCPSNENANANPINEKEERWAATRSSDTKSHASKMELFADQTEPTPSTSGLGRPSVERNRSQERSGEVLRASTSDMLPTLKQNWSSVVQFGKEMRAKKRKKLKTLNVSKSRSYEEVVDEATDDGTETKNASNKRRKKESTIFSATSKVPTDRQQSEERNLPGVENVYARRMSAENREQTGERKDMASVRSMMDLRNLEKSLPTVEGIDARRRSLENRDEYAKGTDLTSVRRKTPVNIVTNVEDRLSPDKSPPIVEYAGVKRAENSDEAQATGNSSFIVLDEGEPVHIRTLNSHQMNDIIGVGERPLAGMKNDVPDNKDQTDNALPLKKRRNLSNTPPCDPSRLSVETTPTKWTVDPTGKRDQPAGDTASVSNSYRGRLSLTRRSTERRSNDSSSSVNNARLSLAKRDLNRQIDEARVAVVASNDDALKNDSGARRMSMKNDEWQCRPVTIPHADRMKQCREDASLVKFRKLGKVFKRRKTRVRFLYLGSTRRKPMVGTICPAFNYQKPCNLVDYLDSQCFQATSEPMQTFGSDLRVTVNDSITWRGDNWQPGHSTVQRTDSLPKATQEAGDDKCVDTNEQDNSFKGTVTVSHEAGRKSSCSFDVVILSTNEERRRSQTQVDEDEPSPTEASRHTISRNTVKLLSPTDDSQLKFLTSESPSSHVATRQSQQVVEDDNPRRDSVFEVKGAHSRALIRRSQQASSNSDVDSSVEQARKRKRAKIPEGSTDEMLHTAKKLSTDEEENDYDSEQGVSTKVTCIKGSDNASGHSKDRTATSIRRVSKASQSSDSDILEHERDESGKRKKLYKRIVPLANSDTDSPDAVPVEDLTASPSSKRQRTSSPDSDCDVELKALVRGWCEDLNISDRCKNKDKPKPVAATIANASREQHASQASSGSRGSRLSNLTTANKTLNTSQRGHLSDKQVPKLAVEKPADKETPMDQDSPDFGATIDKIQSIRNDGLRDEKHGDPGEQRTVAKEETMLDNFNEMMLNFDTNAFDDYFETEKGKAASRHVQLVELNEDTEDSEREGATSSGSRPLKKDVFLPHRSSSSDKENKYQGKIVLRESDSDSDEHEHTLVADFANVTHRRNDNTSEKEKSTRERYKRSNEIERSVATSGQEKACDNKAQEKLIGESETKNADYEQDSLMNITQHYLLIKQFEEDLFGRPLRSNNSYESKEREQCTPTKIKTKNQDTEHSAEEDDIVENTPDKKTKIGVQSNNSPQESSAASLVSKGSEKQLGRTPSSVSERNSIACSTPTSKKCVRPLYQSTPKSKLSSTNSNVASSTKSSIVNVAKESSFRSATIEQDRPKFDPPPRLCFVCSGLMAPQVEQVKRLALMTNADYLTRFDAQVTHVIVKVEDENNGASKTLKYLQGIAHRKWIVSYQWVVDSLMEQRLVNEEPYEAVDCTTLEAGPRNSRLRTRDLFQGFVFLCIGPYVDVSIDQYRDLLQATGATVVNSLDELATTRTKLKIIVIQPDVHDYEIIEWYRKARAVPIVHDWVVECISQYKLISFYPYLQELSCQDVLALGFPDFLVEEEPDEESGSAVDTSI